MLYSDSVHILVYYNTRLTVSGDRIFYKLVCVDVCVHDVCVHRRVLVV
jgi:hypothetical protein